MKYLFLLHRGVDEDLPDFGMPESATLFSAWSAGDRCHEAAGVLIDCAPLEAASSATTVRVRDGETFLTDGPAAELKEQVGGYPLIECEDLDEALGWAATSRPRPRPRSRSARSSPAGALFFFFGTRAAPT